jgi:ATP-dependent Clp endopeptidase proteolytic subunit ClpP
MKNKKTVKNSSLIMKTDKLEIYVFNDISSFWGFSSKDLADALKGTKKDFPVEVYINSLGGEVLEGLAIYNLLSSRTNVTTIVTAMAASIASVIFLAGSKRMIYDNAMVMVHNPKFSVSGGKEDFEAGIDLLQKTEESIRSIYTSRTGKSAEQVTSWMEKDTYFTAEQALNEGFATEVIEALEIEMTGASLQELVAKLSHLQGIFNVKKKLDPKFQAYLEDYCAPLGLKVEDLEEGVLTALQTKFDKKTVKKPAANPSLHSEDDALVAVRKRQAEELDRVEAIQDYARLNGDIELNDDYVKSLGTKATTVRGLASFAVREGWTRDRFELEARRAEKKDMGKFAIHTNSSEFDPQALTCSLVRQCGIPAKATNVLGREYGYESMFPEKILTAADKPGIRDTSLLQVMEQSYIQANGSRYPGRLNTDGFITACREALWKLRAATGNTTWTGLGIFDDVANKVLLAAYEGQNTTWEKWVYTTSVTDFKNMNLYRMTMKGGYLKVGADGELKHGGFDDDKYTVSANTYGKIVGLSRRDIINDDLGALTRIMTALGMEGAKFLEELFYTQLMNQLTTLFPTGGGNRNYLSGATTNLSVDGLSQGETLFMNQIDADLAPLLLSPSILLVGTSNSVVANELFTKTSLQVLQTANSKGRPDENPHVGKFTPVVSPYLNNTNIKARTDAIVAVGAAIPGQTTTLWFLLADPSAAMGSVVIGAFLNGNRRPVVESNDAPFDVLGLQWRAYHDAGVANGDPILGVMSKGAA